VSDCMGYSSHSRLCAHSHGGVFARKIRIRDNVNEDLVQCRQVFLTSFIRGKGILGTPSKNPRQERPRGKDPCRRQRRPQSFSHQKNHMPIVVVGELIRPHTLTPASPATARRMRIMVNRLVRCDCPAGTHVRGQPCGAHKHPKDCVKLQEGEDRRDDQRPEKAK